jgi:hypothetical protein
VKPKVLIGYSACPLTRKAFEEAGCEAWTCDFLPARDGSAFHILGDVWEAILMHSWDAAVFHPMCTYLTVSAAWAFKDPDYSKYPGVGYHQKVKPGTLVGEARRRARDEAIRNFKALLGLPFPVAVENPGHSFLSSAIRPADQIIQPYEYGDDASKATGLWLRGMPSLKWCIEDYVAPRLVCSYCDRVFEYGQHKCPHCHGEKYLPRWANQTDSGQNRLSPSDDRWLQRSETYPGIAAAMGAQWGAYLNRS